MGDLYGLSLSSLMLMLAGFFYFWPRRDRLSGNKLMAQYLALGPSEQHAYQLLDSVPDPAWLRDTSGRYVAVNAAYLLLCNKAREEVIGKQVWAADRGCEPVGAATGTAQAGVYGFGYLGPAWSGPLVAGTGNYRKCDDA